MSRLAGWPACAWPGRFCVSRPLYLIAADISRAFKPLSPEAQWAQNRLRFVGSIHDTYCGRSEQWVGARELVGKFLAAADPETEQQLALVDELLRILIDD